MEKYCRGGQAADDNIIRHMHIVCWILMAIGTHSEYVILFAFLLQQWLHDRALMLRNTYVACFVSVPIFTYLLLH